MATNLNTLPCWLSIYQEQTGKILNKDFGFDKNGLWLIGNYNGSGYPVQTNVEFDTADVSEIIFIADHNSSCSDQGICFFKSDVIPEWSFGNDSSRIAFSINCPEPLIYGQSEESSAGNILNAPNFYTFRIIYDPNADCNNVTAYIYVGQGTGGELLSTLTLSETLPAGAYRIGLSADSDGSEENNEDQKAYFTYLSILRNGVDIAYQEYAIELDNPNRATEGDEGSLDTSLLNGHSIQRTGYIGLTDCSGGFKVIPNVKDGTTFNNQIQGLGNIAGIIQFPITYPTITPCPTTTTPAP
jgi:hypothetical protein